uniref:DRBM domain-containing protein n=1 Tax=Syphacia muris TaxID=451379 RepID=A0A0N5A8L0_9BILA
MENSINRGNFIQRPRKLPAHGKKYSVVGKTAAMVLNELYPDFKEQCQYQTIETPAKIPRFKCSLNVCGETYSAEGSSKKIAKQLACELALKRLRPDITLEGPSFEKAEEEKMNALAEQRAEKKRLEHSKMSNYLYDYFICLCQRKEALTGEKYQPIFDCSKLPSVSMNVTNAKRYLCTLTLSEQGRKYTKESSSKIAGQNCVIKEALLDLFNISLADLRAVEKTAIVLRPSHPMQVLLQALSFYDRSVHIETDVVDEKPVGSKNRFVAKCVLDNEIRIAGPVEDTRQKAKESLCLQVITKELGLEMPTGSLKRPYSSYTPCSALHTLMIKQYHIAHPDIVYSDGIDISSNTKKGPLFKCTVTLNQQNTFEGIGRSKKIAKNAAAEEALKEMFKFDPNAEGAMEAWNSKRLKVDTNADLCNEVCALVRKEYESICHLQGCPLTTHISAFVIIKPDGGKAVVALGAGKNAVIDGRALKSSEGSLLLHMDCSVLARRAFVLYLHKQLEKRDSVDSMFEKSESGKYRFKPGYKIVLYSTYSPNITLTGGEVQKLSCYCGGTGMSNGVLERSQTFEEIISTGCLNVMNVADKMLKWNNLGVQGALLSYVLEPVFISNYFIATLSNDRLITKIVLDRLQLGRKKSFEVKSTSFAVFAYGETYHNWVADIGMLERLDPATGRTVSGAPSRLSKSEMYESWHRLLNIIGGREKRIQWSYTEAKQAETMYGSSVKEFEEQLKRRGFGIWQKKPSAVDNFTLASFDS